jgi:hypothetical protein
LEGATSVTVPSRLNRAQVAHYQRIRARPDDAGGKQEWRRLFSELMGTFFLVLVAGGGGMMGQAFPRQSAADGTGRDPPTDNLPRFNDPQSR